jgi:hypothetical protein
MQVPCRGPYIPIPEKLTLGEIRTPDTLLRTERENVFSGFSGLFSKFLKALPSFALWYYWVSDMFPIFTKKVRAL